MQPAVPHFAKLKTGVVTKSEKGGSQMAVVFDVTHVADAGQWAPLPTPIERTLYLSFSDNAWEYTEKKLLALGFNGDFNAPDFADEAKFEGVELNCRHEEYNGKTTERWELAKWGGAKEIVKADNDAIRQLSAKWKSRTAAPAPKPAGRPTPPPPAPARSLPPAPAASTATATATKPTTKDAAWASVCEAWAGKNADADRDKKWVDALGACLKGRPESALTGDEWAAIAEECAIPF